MNIKTVAIATLGCKVNQCDSASIEESLRERGFTIVGFRSTADCYIINTCTVTHKTDYQSRQLIRRAHKQNPRSSIIVTGCYAQVAPQALTHLPGVSHIVGNAEKQQIVDLLTTPFKGTLPQVIVSDINQETVFKDPPLHTFPQRTRAFLKIQDGCESFCSYCIVPYARGKCRSLPPQDVVERLSLLYQAGFQEAVLSGIHLGAYGLDLNPPYTLVNLLQTIEQRKPITRIRLSSLEPMDITDELIAFLPTSAIVCPHLHLPLQSGSDEILERMQRPYRVSHIRKLVQMLVCTIPTLCLGVDVIVGFPGETDTHFLATLNLLEELPISYVHVFPFSRRKPTPAASLPEQIPHPVINARSKKLRQLGKSKRAHYYSLFLKKKLEVLIEGKREPSSGLLRGRSRNYVPVLIEGPNDLKHQKVEVEITRVEGERVWGEVRALL